MSNFEKNQRNEWAMTRRDLNPVIESVRSEHATKIPARDVVIGDEMVSSFSKSGVVLKTSKVTEKWECPGQWRTHVHINRTNCFDSRCHVWVVR